MKTLSSPESPRQRTMRRISKPLMEKRRRERINQSLETLRLLMLDSTHNEKLKNPKVEKAEILESVVLFLKTGKEVDEGHRATKKGLSGEQGPLCGRQSRFHDGVRSCLLRVSHFIASQSHQPEGSGGGSVQASLPPAHRSSPGSLLVAAPDSSGPGALPPHCLPHHRLSHPYLTQTPGLHCGTELLSPAAACTHIPDPVWRPWPQ